MPRSVRHTRKRNLTEPYSVNELQYWYDYPTPKDGSIKHLYNPVKERWESWHRCSRGAHEYVLVDIHPGRVWRETFIGPIHDFAGLVGLSLDKTWSVNGDPAPAAANFVEANEIGGGLILRCLGANDNDWIAIHTGGQYATVVRKSPHLKIMPDIVDTAEVYMLGGLVGSSNLETGNGAAWTTPDDGIWVEYDTDVDNNMRFVTRTGGVQTTTSLGTPPPAPSNIIFMTNDQATEVKLCFNGTIAARHTTNLPTTPLKPLAMVGTRVDAGGVQKDLQLHDLRLIFDRGF